MEPLFATDRHNSVLLVQRVALAAIMFAHGAQKLFGWWGGFGYHATMHGFVAQGIPAVLAFLVIMAETVGALLLVLGLFTRLGALGIAAVMVGAIAQVHAPNGFFMNWAGTKPGEGFEYHLLALAIAVPILIWGGGRWAVDSEIADRLERTPRAWREADAMR
jgi:putative oxidoreductase